MLLDMDLEVVYELYKRMKREKVDLDEIVLRTRKVRGVYFNLKILSEQQRLANFRFPKADVYIVFRIINLTNGRANHRGYIYDELPAG